MSTSFQPRRAIPSALNTPTEVRVIGGKSVSAEEAERYLTTFIDASELITSGVENSNANSIGLSDAPGNGPILAQLRRIQRDLRGLPPLAAELPSGNKRSLDDSEPAPPMNKKIKFEDEDEEQESDAEKESGSSSNSDTENNSIEESQEARDTPESGTLEARDS